VTRRRYRAAKIVEGDAGGDPPHDDADDVYQRDGRQQEPCVPELVRGHLPGRDGRADDLADDLADHCGGRNRHDAVYRAAQHRQGEPPGLFANAVTHDAQTAPQGG